MVPLESLLSKLRLSTELQSPAPTGHRTGNQVFYYIKKPEKMSIVEYNLTRKNGRRPF